jgi:hypothetical protein
MDGMNGKQAKRLRQTARKIAVEKNLSVDFVYKKLKQLYEVVK